jgi:cytidine deaminase
VYLGCNVENAAYGPTNCAERTAFFKAVSEGEREFEAIAVCGAVQGQVPDKACPPCGVCRQVMSEFCDGNFRIILYDPEKGTKAYTLDEILPQRFDLGEYK